MTFKIFVFTAIDDLDDHIVDNIDMPPSMVLVGR